MFQEYDRDGRPGLGNTPHFSFEMLSIKEAELLSLTVAGQRRTLTGFAFSALASGPWAPLAFNIQLPAVYSRPQGLSTRAPIGCRAIASKAMI